MPNPVHLLLIDDDAAGRYRIRQELEAELPGLVVSEVATADAYRRALASGDFDIVLTDSQLPWADGLTILRELKREWAEVPVLMVTGSGNEEIAIESIKAGLDDYVLKSATHLARLPAAVRLACQRAEQRQALAEQERGYRTLFERLPVGLFRTTWEGEFLDVNPALVEMLGYPDREALLEVGEKALFARPDGWEAWRRRLAAQGTLRGQQVEIRRHDGQTLWARLSGRTLEGDAGRLHGCEVWLEDVTQQKRGEWALQAYTRQLETARALSSELSRELELQPLAALIARRAAELVGAAAAAVHLWDGAAKLGRPVAWYGYAEGYRPPAWRPGEGLAGRVAVEERPLLLEAEPGAGDPARTPPGSGSGGPFLGEPLHHHGRLVGVLTLDRGGPARRFDEQDRRLIDLFATHAAAAIATARLFDEVAQAKADWEGTFDAAADLIAVLDPSFRIRRANRALAERLGCPPEELIGRPCYQLLDGESGPPPGCPLLSCLQNGGAVTEEGEIAGARGTFLRTYSPLCDHAGRPVGVVLTAKDVTEQRALQEKLIQADKMAAIGRLIAGVAHELSNPLTSVIGQAQLLQLGAPDEQTRLGAQMVAAEAERAVQIVRNLLTIARPQRLERRAVDLAPLLREVVAARDMELRICNIGVEIQATAPLPAAAADRLQLRQVLINLLSNAEQAVSATGRPGQIRLLLDAAGEAGRLRLRVEDTGCGIPEPLLPRIFDPFVTTKASGSGLGLSICYAILEEHGGRIRAGNRPEGGAWFELELPSAVAPETPEPAPERPPAPLPLRILVADDEPSILRILANILRLDGHSVETAADGHSAAAHLAAADYDLLFLDVRMPGLDGRHLYDEVICRRPHPPRVIVITGDTLSPDTRSFLERTGLECLEKPFTVDGVRGILGRG